MTAAVEPLADAPAPQLPLRRLRRDALRWLATAWLALVVFGAVTASWLPIADPLDVDVSSKLARPGEDGFLLGSDGLGRDIFARAVHGSRVSLVVSLAAVAIGVLGGGALGMVAGYVRGSFDRAVTAVIDLILAFPALILLLGLVSFVGQSLAVITVTIGVLSIPRYARVARASTLAAADREFTLAANLLGATRWRIMTREIAPNIVMPVVAFGLVSIGVVIVLEGSLSFLGLSVQPPTPTWGGMMAEGRRYLDDAPHVSAVPATVMFLTVLAINVVGDHLRSRFFDLRSAAI